MRTFITAVGIIIIALGCGCAQAVECPTVKGSVDVSDLEYAVSNGFWNCAKDVTAMLQKSGIDVSNAFDMANRNLLKELQVLKTFIDSSKPIKVVNPTFQWAQSPTEILLNIKFSHKWDAPATLNVEVTNVTIADNKLILLASNGMKSFKLHLDMLRNVIPEECTWSLASVGRMTMQLKKADGPTRWARLLRNKAQKMGNMHMWWEMHEKHAAALDDLQDADTPVASKTTVTPAEAGSATEAAGGESTGVTEDLGSPPFPPSQTGAAAVVTEEAAVSIDGTSETPSIASLTAEQLAVKRLADEHKLLLKQMDDEGRARKKAIDVKAKADKVAIDQELAERKALAEQKHQQHLLDPWGAGDAGTASITPPVVSDSTSGTTDDTAAVAAATASPVLL